MSKLEKMLSGQQIWQMGGFYIRIHVKEPRENGLAYTTVRVASLTNLRTWPISVRAADSMDAKVYQTAAQGVGSKQPANGELKGGRRE